MCEGLLLSIRCELDAYAALLQPELETLTLWHFVKRARPRFWGQLELESLDDDNGWFTIHYLQPLERARVAVGDPWWWRAFRERCLQKERWDHPHVDVHEQSARWGGHNTCSGLVHAELAQSVVLFYSTLYAALHRDIEDPDECYELLERARRRVLVIK